MLRFLQKLFKVKFQYMPSRLFIYYGERTLEGTVMQDSGATISDLVKSISQFGVCPETGNPLWSWSYSDGPIKFRLPPLPLCFTDAKNHVAIKSKVVAQTEMDIASVLASGFPVIIGFQVYESFESDQVAKTGIVPMTSSNEQVLGGHCVVLCGQLPNFNNTGEKYYICRNSWSVNWGDKGYFYIPAKYLLNPDMAEDFWTITQMSDK